MGACGNCSHLQNVSSRKSKKNESHKFKQGTCPTNTPTVYRNKLTAEGAHLALPTHIDQPSLVSRQRRNQTGIHCPVETAPAEGFFPSHKSAAPGEGGSHGRATNLYLQNASEVAN